MKRLRKLLFPLSPLYAAVVWLRNKAYDLGWFSSTAFATPILCVGNLSVGGTGKTPMVEWLLSHYLPEHKIAVLSRGYKRKSKGFHWVRPDSRVAETGDEPLQMARRFPGAFFAVDADRRHGIQQIVSEAHPDLIILDDGFQHRKVLPKRSILLTAWDALYTEQNYRPAGDLRDHRNQAARADLIIVTKCPQEPSQEERQAIRERLKLPLEKPLAFATLEYDVIRDQDGAPVKEADLHSATVNLITGIANPQPLLRHLDRAGMNYEHIEFPDHHHFSDAEASEIQASGQVLTTSKDATRIGEFLGNYWVIDVAHRFATEDRGTLEKVLEGIRG